MPLRNSSWVNHPKDVQTHMRGFSLIELLLALAISLGIGAAMFQLFHQNERVFRDQHLIIEMQQGARAAAAQIADEVRMAGEGVPVFASTFDDGKYEAVAAILPSSTATRIDFRAVETSSSSNSNSNSFSYFYSCRETASSSSSARATECG